MINETNPMQVGPRGIAAGWLVAALLCWVAMAVYALLSGAPLGM